MRVLGKQWLEQLSKEHADARSAVESWLALAEAATWRTPHELKQWDPKASLVGGSIAIFNNRNNRYRLEAMIDYRNSIVRVRWAGDHSEYDRRRY